MIAEKTDEPQETQVGQPRLVRHWGDLAKVGDSETHTLEIGEHNGWINAKDKRRYDDSRPHDEQIAHLNHYLSTHTFYGSKFEYSTKLLQDCGFNVVCANWDA